jgi:hypothetical protein
MTPVLQKALSDKPYRQILSPDVFDIKYIDGLVDDYLDNTKMPVSSLGDLYPVAMLSLIGWYGKE